MMLFLSRFTSFYFCFHNCMRVILGFHLLDRHMRVIKLIMRQFPILPTWFQNMCACEILASKFHTFRWRMWSLRTWASDDWLAYPSPVIWLNLFWSNFWRIKISRKLFMLDVYIYRSHIIWVLCVNDPITSVWSNINFFNTWPHKIWFFSK